MWTAARVVLLATALLLPAAPARADGGSIAFLSDRTGYDALWAIDADGTRLRALTDARPSLVPREVWLPEFADHDYFGSWSPDGRRMAFSGIRRPSMTSKIFVADVDSGAFPRRVTSPRSQAHEHKPEWSPDGRYLAFGVRHRFTGPPELWTLDLVTGTERRVGASTDFNHFPGPSSWSADGRRLLAFDHSRQRFITVAPDGSDTRVVIVWPVSGPHAGWAPVGRRLAFLQNSAALTIDEDGRRPRRLRLAGQRTSVSTPVWSPDACWLAYTAVGPAGDAPTELRVRPTRRGRPRVLATFPSRFEATPAWSPDGRHIALSVYDGPTDRFERPKGDLVVVPVEGGTPRRLVDEPEVWNHSPVWRPDPRERARHAARRRSGKSCRAPSRRTPASEQGQPVP